MTITIDGREFVTHETAARLLGISPKTLFNWLWSGRITLTGVHVGREPLYLRAELPADR